MTKAQMLNEIDYQTILKMMLPPDAINQVKHDVEVFYQRRHNLPIGVLNAILVKTIKATGQNLFNEAYLRKVTETFKAENIKTVNTAIEHIERNHDHTRALDRKQRASAGEPDWMNDYIKDLALQG